MSALLRIFCCLTLFSPWILNSVSADPIESSPKHFYEQDFAKKPGEDSLAKEQQQPSNLNSKTKNEASSIKADEPPASNEPDISGSKVLAIGIVVGGDGSEKSHENLLALKELAIRFELPVSEVLVVGGIGLENDQPILAALGVMGGQIKIVETAEEEYPIKQSPTWIVETAQGKILLEGIDSIERYFNSRGEFVERAGPALGAQ